MLKRRVTRLLKTRFLRKAGIEAGEGVVLNGLPRIMAAPGSTIQLGKRVVLTSRWDGNALGVSQPCTLITTHPEAKILIGDDSGLSGSTISAMRLVVIGKRVLLGEGVLITDNNHHVVDLTDVSKRRYERPSLASSATVVVEDDAFVGARTIILKGVTIGRGTVVGAGSVVTSSLPANVVAAGNPCRVLRALSGDEREKYEE